MTITYNDVLTILSIIAVAMLIILLYHLIFVSVSLKKIANRMDDLSKEVEAVVLKPIGAIEFLLDWFSGMVEGMMAAKEEGEHHHKKVHHKK